MKMNSFFTVLFCFSVSSAIAQEADTDRDRLPDTWETTYFGDLSRDSDGDFDTDGLTNEQEYIIGSDPTLPDSDSNGTNDKDQLTVSGSGTITGSNSANIFIGSAGVDTVTTYDGNDTVFGGGDGDVIQARLGNNKLYGEDGQDTIIIDRASYWNSVNNYSNTIVGGPGDDILQGYSGADTYVYYRGDGQDTINDWAESSSTTDRIVFGGGILFSDITIQREGGDLVIHIGDPENPQSEDKITVQNALSDGVYRIEEYEFSDAQEYSYGGLYTRPWYGLSDQEETIYATNNSNNIYGGLGRDIIYAYDGNDRVYGEEGNDTITARLGNNTLEGGEGNDTLIIDRSSYWNSSNNYSNTLNGGLGNDRLEGYASSDTYIFNRGDGSDRINDFSENSTTTDRVVFGGGILFSDITIQRVGGDLVIHIADPDNPESSDRITVENALSDSDYRIEEYEFVGDQVYTYGGLYTRPWYGLSDQEETIYATNNSNNIYGGLGRDIIYAYDGNDRIYGEEGNDTITARLGNNTLEGGEGSDTLIIDRSSYWNDSNNYSNTFNGGLGNDRLEGYAGNDTYIFNRGDGSDTINDWSESSTTTDRVVFGGGILFSDITIQRVGGDLVIHIGDPNNSESSDRITVENALSDGNFRIEEYEFVGDQVYTYGGLYTRPWYGLSDQEETIHATNNSNNIYGGPGRDIIYAYDGNDRVYGEEGDDTITARLGNNTLEGGEGNDTLIIDRSSYWSTSNNYSNTFNGGLGDDRLEGYASSDTYIYNRGDGNDTINDWSENSTTTDRIVFGGGILFSDITIQRDGGDLVIHIADPNNPESSERITVENALSDGNFRIEEYEFVGDQVYTYGGLYTRPWYGLSDQEETIYATNNSNNIYGGLGRDIIYAYDGNDRVRGEQGDDTITARLGNNTLEGGEGNDTLIIDRSSYWNSSNNYSNTFNGGLGDDRLEGYASNDTYIFNRGDGNDTINDWSENSNTTDRINFGEGISQQDLAVSIDGDDIIVHILDVVSGAIDTITIENAYTNSSYRIEQYVLTDNTTLSHSNILALPAAPTQTSILEVWYTMDNVNGSTLVDEIGTSDASLIDIEFVAGQYGNAAQFNGVSSEAIMPSGLPTDGPYSISFWVKAGPQDGNIFSNFNAQPGGTAVGMTSAGNIVYFIDGRITVGSDLRMDSTTVFDGAEYQHVAVVYDGGDNYSIYINGVQEASWVSGKVQTADDAFKLGRNVSGTDTFFLNGEVDDFRVYNIGLTAEQVQTIIEIDSTPVPPRVVFEAETANLLGIADVYSDASASNGQGVTYISDQDSGVSFTSVPASDSALIRYASAISGSISVRVNGVDAGNVIFTPTGDWVAPYGNAYFVGDIPDHATFEIIYESDDSAIAIDYVEFNTNSGGQTSVANVSDLSVASENQSLSVSWNAPAVDSSYVVGYRVYLDDQQHSGDLSPETTSYDITGLAEGTAYTVRVTLLDVFGNESTGITIASATSLANPENLIATPKNGIIELSWDSVAPDYLLEEYNLYYSTSSFADVSGMAAAQTVPSNQTNVVISGLENGTTYYLAVTAVNIYSSENTIVATIEQTPNPEPIQDVSNVAVNSANQSLSVSWNAPSNDAIDIIGYRVYVNGSQNGSDIPSTQTSYVINDLEIGTSYDVRVTALGAAGDESAGITVTSATQLANPVNVITIPNYGAVALSWNAVEPASLLTEYKVYYSSTEFTDVSAMTAAQTIPANQTNTVVSGLANGTSYYFAVTAVNIYGAEYTTVNSILETTNIEPIGEVRDVNVSPEGQILVVTWQVPEINPENVLGYRVYVNGVQNGSDIAADQFSYTVNSLNYGTSYSIRVTALGNGGFESEGLTATGRTWLANPANLNATAKNSTLELSWNAVTPANLLDSYKVYYSTATFTDVSSMTAVQTIAAGQTTATLTDLENGTNYFIAVTAEDISGEENTVVTVIQAAPSPEPIRQVNNVGVASFTDSLAVSWQAPDNDPADIIGYRVYVNDTQYGADLDANTMASTITGLNSATSYDIRVTALGLAGDESAGVVVSGVTWLSNPVISSTEALNGMLELEWNAITPANYVANYVIYASETEITDLSVLTPALTVDANTTAARIAGLNNRTTYNLAVTTINTSGGENTEEINVVQAAPEADTQGPDLTNIQVNGVALTNSMTVDSDALITLDVTDPIGVGRIEFYVNGTLTTSDYNYADGVSLNWSITNIDDGLYTIEIVAFDTLENETRITEQVNVAIAPPVAPVIVSPPDGYTTNATQASVRGSSAAGTQVTVFNNGEQVAGPLSLDFSNNFVAIVDLTEGVNAITASATNRGGQGEQSSAVSITLDTSLPGIPVSVTAVPSEGGEVNINWGIADPSSVASYNIYRAIEDFESIDAATKLNGQPITSTSYTDIPFDDGVYYYAIEAVNNLGTAGNISNRATATVDSTPPRALNIEYTSRGNYDATYDRFGTGVVEVLLTVNEELITTPFLTIAPQDGLPIAVDLKRESGTAEIQYYGEFLIEDSTQPGTALAVFSARDLYGNRGTEIDAGQELTIDTLGPEVNTLTINPGAPIRNDESVDVTVNLILSGQPEGTPSLFYQLSGEGREEVEITSLTEGSGINEWTATFNLGDAGLLEAELLSFRFSALDDLNNVGTRINGVSEFQVYQGELPPLGYPFDLQATAQPSGQVSLTWSAVAQAQDYQLYRQGPNETELLPLTLTNGELTYIDQTPEDGEYRYAVATVRSENDQQTTSSPSPSVSVTAIATIPNAPTGMTLTLISQGILVDWTAPLGSDIHYNLYRSTSDITSTDGLNPIIDNIYSVQALDVNPTPAQQYYAVTTVDAAGNESEPVTAEPLNIELFPVNPFTIEVQDDQSPVVDWGHVSSTIVGYDIYLGDSATGLKLNTNELLSESIYTDNAYSNDERVYTIIPFDGVNYGPERSLVLPAVQVDLTEDSGVERGVLNRLVYTLTNSGTTALDNAVLKAEIENYNHQSESFDLEAGETIEVEVIVGGYDDLPALAQLITTIELSANSSERVTISQTSTIEVTEAALVLGVNTRDLTRGATGQVQFALENTSDVEIEVITARNSGSRSSDQIRFTLKDEDDNTLTSQPYIRTTSLQESEVVITQLSNGTTVARIPAGATMQSDWFDMSVPASAPNNMTLEMTIDSFHSGFGSQEHVAIGGLSTRKEVVIIDTSYRAEITSITPQSSYGDSDIIISGRALENNDSGTEVPVTYAPVKLIIASNGFEREYEAYTNELGEYAYTFTPSVGEAGIFRVSAIHPDRLDRPEQSSFNITRVTASPSEFNLNIAYNYEQVVPIRLNTAEGTTATNARLVYEAGLQTSGEQPEGVNVDVGSPVNIGSGGRATINVTISGTETAESEGQVILALRSDESGDDNLALVQANYSFSEARPAMFVSPSYIETGLAQGSSIIESVTIENRGLDTLENVRLDLLGADGNQAPDWVYLAASSSLGDIDVGGSKDVNININPAEDLDGGIYSFDMRITSDNAATYTMPLFVSVTNSGVGNVLFKLSDIYTATLDENGEVIRGLEDARISLQNEVVYTEEYSATTDSFGEAFLENLPAGTYTFRVTASNHQETSGRIRILPGVTETRDVFLDYSLVTVHWSVNEITIEDRYEITLNATFETDVPAAVVVASPLSTTIPDMESGDVFYGEIILTNHGLIKAENFEFTMPSSDQYFSYEILAELPDSIDAKEKLSIPYRIVSLSPLNPDAQGTGGGCYSHNANANFNYDYECSNGTRTNGGGGSSFYSAGDSKSCSSGGSGGSRSSPVPTFSGGSSSGSASPSVSVSEPIPVSGMPGCRPTGDDKCSSGNGI